MLDGSLGVCAPYSGFTRHCHQRAIQVSEIMPANRSFLVVLVTAPDLKTARKLGKLAVEKRVAACANLIPQLESHYWWQGKIVRSAEVLIVLKTTARRWRALEELIRSNHPYDTPEIIALPLSQGYNRYLEWISASVGT
jgi:periplasmic divalent cation tolerance protein